MSLSAEIQRKAFLYFGVSQATDLGTGNVFFLPVVNQLQTALTHLTAAGETSVIELIAILDLKWADLQTVGDSLLVRDVGAITLRGDEFDARRGVFNFWLAQLDRVLFPVGQSLMDAGGGAQGPAFEP